jgi:ABC-type antimicrobial peptide transport system permease subunit
MARDTDTSPKVAIVNERFARHFFPDGSPIGRHVTSLDITYEIVGVVKDAKYVSLRDDIRKTVYIPWKQREGDQPSRYTYLVRLAEGFPMGQITPSLDRLVREADPALRVRSVRTYDTVVDQSIVTERLMAMLGGFFGVVALVVASIGLFGILAFHVARRTNELGIRMALGARRSAMVSLVLRDVAGMVVIGLIAGTLIALTVTGLARTLLFGFTPTDPRVFAIAASVLTLAALAAAWLPARRAARVDPMAALRHE